MNGDLLTLKKIDRIFEHRPWQFTDNGLNWRLWADGQTKETCQRPMTVAPSAWGIQNITLSDWDICVQFIFIYFYLKTHIFFNHYFWLGNFFNVALKVLQQSFAKVAEIKFHKWPFLAVFVKFQGSLFRVTLRDVMSSFRKESTMILEEPCRSMYFEGIFSAAAAICLSLPPPYTAHTAWAIGKAESI